MPFKRGDHICAIYSTTEELSREVPDFWPKALETASGAGTSGVAMKWICFATGCDSSASM